MIEKQTIKNFLQLAKEIATYAKEMRLDGKWFGGSNYFVNDSVFFGAFVIVSDSISEKPRFSIYCAGIDSEDFRDSLNSLYLSSLSDFNEYRSKNDKELAEKAEERKKAELEKLESRIAEIKQQLNLE